MRGNGDTLPAQHDVRYARSRTGAGRARVLEKRRGASLLLIQNGIRAIDGPELDRRIVEQGREIRRRQGWIDALDVARVGLLYD